MCLKEMLGENPWPSGMCARWRNPKKAEIGMGKHKAKGEEV
jgi:hypothetical protein